MTLEIIYLTLNNIYKSINNSTDSNKYPIKKSVQTKNIKIQYNKVESEEHFVKVHLPWIL